MRTLATLEAYRDHLKDDRDRLKEHLAATQDQLDTITHAINNYAKLADMAEPYEGRDAAVGKSDPGPSISQRPHIVPGLRKPTRVRGVLALVREIVTELTGPFDKNAVMEKLRARDSQLAADVSPANLRNTLRILAKSGDIAVETNATSTSCATYVSKRTAA